MKLTILALIISTNVSTLAGNTHVRQEILDQLNPITVYVSIDHATNLQFPELIHAIQGSGFTSKQDEAGDFYVSVVDNCISITSLHAGAEQNLGVIIHKRSYTVKFVTAADNHISDFQIIFQYPPPPKDPSDT
jgi:hypothetical protein